MSFENYTAFIFALHFFIVKSVRAYWHTRYVTKKLCVHLCIETTLHFYSRDIDFISYSHNIFIIFSIVLLSGPRQSYLMRCSSTESSAYLTLLMIPPFIIIASCYFSSTSLKSFSVCRLNKCMDLNEDVLGKIAEAESRLVDFEESRKLVS